MGEKYEQSQESSGNTRQPGKPASLREDWRSASLLLCSVPGLQTTSPTYGSWERPDGTKRTTKLMQQLAMGCLATEGAIRGGCHRRGNLTKGPRKKGKPPASGRQQFNHISQSELWVLNQLGHVSLFGEEPLKLFTGCPQWPIPIHIQTYPVAWEALGLSGQGRPHLWLCLGVILRVIRIFFLNHPFSHPQCPSAIIPGWMLQRGQSLNRPVQKETFFKMQTH